MVRYNLTADTVTHTHVVRYNLTADTVTHTHMRNICEERNKPFQESGKKAQGNVF